MGQGERGARSEARKAEESRGREGERGEQGGRPNRLKKTDRSVCLVPSIKVEALTCGQLRDFVLISWGWRWGRVLIVLAYRARSARRKGEREGGRRPRTALGRARVRLAPRRGFFAGRSKGQGVNRSGRILGPCRRRLGDGPAGKAGELDAGQEGRPPSDRLRLSKGGRRASGSDRARLSNGAGGTGAGRPQARRANSTEQIFT